MSADDTLVSTWRGRTVWAIATLSRGGTVAYLYGGDEALLGERIKRLVVVGPPPPVEYLQRVVMVRCEKDVQIEDPCSFLAPLPTLGLPGAYGLDAEDIAEEAPLKPLGVVIPKGADVWLRDGTKCDYLQPVQPSLGSDHVAHLVSVEVGCGDEGWNEHRVVSEVFLEAPVAEKEAQIVKLDAEIDAKRNALQVIRNEIGAMQAQARDVAKTTARVRTQHRALSNLEALLDGKVTHFVTIKATNMIDIETADVALEVSKENRVAGHKVRLLSLFGTSLGDLSWRMNTFSDGSGVDWEAFPCTSLEEARAKAQTLLDELFGSTDSYKRDKAHFSAKKLGLVVPQNVDDEVRREALAHARAAVTRLETEAQAAHNRLNSIIRGIL